MGMFDRLRGQGAQENGTHNPSSAANASEQGVRAAAEPLGGVNAKVAARQRLMLLGGGSVLLAAGLAYIGSQSKPSGGPAPTEAQEIRISTDQMVGRKLAQKEWVAQSENQIAEINGRLKTAEGKVDRVSAYDERIAQLEQENARIKADGARLFQIYEAQNKGQAAKIAALETGTAAAASPAGPTASGVARWQQPGAEPFRVAGAAGAPPQAGVSRWGGGAPGGEQGFGPGFGPGGMPTTAEVKTISFTTPGKAGDKDAGTGFVSGRPDAPPTLIEDSPDYLPPNSYAPARVIVGVDASAGVSSQTDPLPVVLRITGPARSVVNNGKLLTTRLEGCVVNGAARGDLSAEKVYVKLAKMTCDQPGGRVAVSEVKGFISFAGKTGVRGKVVSREGNLVTQAMIAGIAGGFGRGFTANANAIFRGGLIAAPGQPIPQLDASQIATAGLGQGVGQAADMVSKYLIERAEQYQPIIEMPTGIDVEIVFLDGVYVRGQQ